MELNVIRTHFGKKTTIGIMYMDGVRFCYTLEDVVRGKGEAKVASQTAIPAGRYDIVINESPRFGKRMPLLMSVPGFTGVRIHTGNSAGDTEGCILVGFQKHGQNRVGLSKPAFKQMMEKLEASIAQGGKISISIQNGVYIYDIKQIVTKSRVIV